MSERLQFAVLGSLQITRARQPVRLGGAQLRTLLATLLLRANQPVSLADIGDRLWDQAPPPRARRVIQIYIVRLRQVLDGRDLIRTDSGGYRIHLGPDQLDLLRFDTLLGTAATTPDLSRRAALLAEALTLSRGPACADIASDVLHARDVAPILERRLDAEEQLIDAELALGRHAARISQLRRLVAEHPLRERFTGQLMLALYRSGRRAEALATYQRARDVLVRELGIEPGAELQCLHGQVLGTDPALELPRGRVALWVAPAQLPGDSVTFTGRRIELEQLLALPDNPRCTPTAVPHCAIDGMPGVGKTALAVHVAHRLSNRFPDGQLFLDLHGFSRDVAPVDPADALDRLLRTLGVPGSAIPDGQDDRAALYRTTLAHRRMLVVLDNAASEAQIRPLLPGAPGCLAIITSRRRLVGVDHAISLDVLPHHDAITLLTRAIAPPVRNGQFPALDDIVRTCGHLPLAIRIAADRLRLHPTWTPTDLARRLQDPHRRLTELSAGRRGVTPAFDLSYRALPPEARRLFRLLALHPDPVIDPHTTATLANLPLHHTRRLLETLHDAHLLRETSPARYRLHDLLRTYATHLTHTHDPTSHHHSALRRLFDHYTHTGPSLVG